MPTVAVGIGVAILTGTMILSPALISFWLVILFFFTIACTVLLNLAAMPSRVSPVTTMYVISPVQPCGIGVGVFNCVPGGGMRILSPTFILLGSIPGFIWIRTCRSTPNFSAIVDR